MKVYNNTITNYSEDPIRFWNFEQFQDKANDVDLFIGCHPSPDIKQLSNNKKIFFSTEEQLENTDTTNDYVEYVDKILTICPEAYKTRPKREFVFFPLNEAYLPLSVCTDEVYKTKKHDVIYTGFAAPQHFHQIINCIKKFNYCFVSFHHQASTHRNVSYAEKLKLISESRCCVVHNLIKEKSPQLKSRTFEAAFCKSLILCRKDNFNCIESWFTPNIDFLYWENEMELIILIELANKDPEFYKKITENAYKKAMNNYTCKHFIEKYIGFKP